MSLESPHKIAGCCTVCDKRVFDVLGVYEEHEPNAGEPKRLGPAHEGAVRVTFLLFDGTKADFTFCGECARELSTVQYVPIWKKAMRSWARELKGKLPDWYREQFSNGLLVELGRKPWTEIQSGR